MPPSGKLKDQQIADLTEWVKMGAPDPREEAAAAAPAKKGINFADARKFWSLQPLKSLPPDSSIDRFLRARLEEKHPNSAAPADKRTLIRRATFDLTGLPPTPREVEDFLADPAPTAFAKVVDRLLASPHYGERWARHWLDLVRYAETNGHEFDNDKVDAWRYRDYVIRAFNEDIPYNQFVKEHIAGDLLPEKRLSRDRTHWESPLGTSFYWFGEILNSATDSVKSRADEVDNQIDVLSKAFFGLTVACARCHDHKFDPIPTADYYSLAGVMHSTTLNETVIDSPERERQIAAKVQVGQAIRLPTDEAAFEDFSGPDYAGWRVAGQAFGPGPVQGVASSYGGSEGLMGSLTSRKFRMPKLYVHVSMAGSKSEQRLKERSPLRVTLVADGHKSEHAMPDGSGSFQWRTMRMTKEIGRLCYFEIVDRSADGYIAVDKIVFSDSAKPPADADVARAIPLPTGHGDQSIPASIFATIASDEDPHDVRIHIRGNHQSLGEPAPRRFLQVIAGENQPPIRAGSGRLEIAEKIASADNPLTARVMVNRIWKHHFGYGLVRSTDNFGRTGDAPTHPELLDYLARRFIERLVGEGHAPADAAIERIPDVQPREPGGGQGRSRKQAAAPFSRSAFGSGGDPRCHSGGSGYARPADARAQRAALHQQVPGWPRQAGVRSARRRGAAQHLYSSASELPDADVPGVRLPAADLGHRPAQCLDGAIPGVDPHERRVSGTRVARMVEAGDGRGE